MKKVIVAVLVMLFWCTVGFAEIKSFDCKFGYIAIFVNSNTDRREAEKVLKDHILRVHIDLETKQIFTDVHEFVIEKITPDFVEARWKLGKGVEFIKFNRNTGSMEFHTYMNMSDPDTFSSVYIYTCEKSNEKEKIL